MMETQTRRNLLKGAVALGGAMMASGAALAQSGMDWTKRIVKRVPQKDMQNAPKAEVALAQTPLFSGIVVSGPLVFIAGIGAHFAGDIAAHTKHVLDEVEENLIRAGSSMEKVVKVNVYLADLKDYDGMNNVYRGRFGANPPVRTTIAAAGVPGNSLVEIDCIATL